MLNTPGPGKRTLAGAAVVNSRLSRRRVRRRCDAGILFQRWPHVSRPRKEPVMDQLEKVLYTAKTHTTGGRDGAAQSSDGRLDVKLSSPGASGNGTNPEQLFAAGWSACFL